MKNSPSYQSYLKSPYKSVKHSTYFETYDELFSRYRDKDITFVEIGVLGGGSLFMWRDFFGPKARIIGIDLNPNAKKWEAHGFEIFIGSQSDENFWKDFTKKVGPVDVVLDDGGHSYTQQIVTTEMLLDAIKDRGMLVVEDTHTSYLSGYGAKRYSFTRYVKNFIDRINHRFHQLDPQRADHRVWSIQSFESIVAFHINRQASNLPSESTTNNGTDDAALNYRHFDNSVMDAFEKDSSRLRFLGRIPGFKRLAFKITKLVRGRLDSAGSKYF